MTRYRVGIDIGGTFTDIVLVGDDDLRHSGTLEALGNCDHIKMSQSKGQ